MSAIALLDELKVAGVVVGIATDNPGSLDVDGPDEALTPERMAMLRTLKSELLVELARRDNVDRRLAAQLALLIPLRTADRRLVLVNPRYQRDLERAGLL